MYFQKHLPLWQVKSESKEGSSGLEGSRSVWRWTDTDGFHQDCIFLWMATRSGLQTQLNQRGKQNPHDIQPAWQKMGPAHLLWDTGAQSPHQQQKENFCMKRSPVAQLKSLWIMNPSWPSWLLWLCIHCWTPYSWVNAQKYFGSEQIYLISPKCSISK